MNVIIIHGSNPHDKEKLAKGEPPQNKRHWIPWIKEKLEKKDIKVNTPLMPKNWNPKYEEWKKEFEKLDINKETILIGHSAGGAFIVKWLGETKKKIKKLILIAPAKSYGKKPSDIFLKKLWEFCNFEIDKEILNLVEEIIIFFSDDEKESIKQAIQIYCKELSIVPIKLRGKGHFTERSMGTKEFPELLEEILN